MDETDRKIVDFLKGDARTPMTALAGRLGLSEGAVRKRIKKLMALGYIKRFTIETASEGIISAVVLVQTTPSVSTPEIASRIRNVKGVEVVYEVTGQYDITAIVSGEDVNMLNSSIDEIRQIPGIISTNTLISLRVWRK
ncbi:Lrp/AsnC family transcriptional regulator [Candidatus Bathyarchaeota archaeon]|nr:Lrp/AsnC family transcriptional regulator [Candidatus Bathyarchaeota archaeon]MBS7627508.1 Lrp/AsnC family transcriptional regulator [Candidatus Bathyarchaeota archaeon]